MSDYSKLPTLLLITTNPTVRYWVKKHLDSRFHLLDAAKEPQALEFVRTIPIDYILLDSTFEEDPLRLSREIRQELSVKQTALYLITGRLSRAYREKAMSAGVTDFLMDPLDLTEFDLRLEERKKVVIARQKTAHIFATSPKSNKASSSLKNKTIKKKK